MPFKLLLESVGAITALVCFATAVKAFLNLHTGRVEKRLRDRQLRTMPSRGAEERSQRAG